MAQEHQPQANPDLLWADLPTLRWELNVSAHDAEADIQLPRLLGAAIDEVERYIRLPVRPTRVVRDVRAPGAGQSLRYTDAPYLLSVEGVEYWTRAVPKADGVPPPETWYRVDGLPKMGADFHCEPCVLDEPWGPWWIRPTQGAGDWPEEATRFRVTAMTGLRPAEHQAVSQALIMLVRDLYEGVSVADRMPAWRRRVSGLPYRLFWNPR